MKAIRQIVALLGLVAMLASFSFATAECTLCALHAEKSGALAAKRVTHDHCGAGQSDEKKLATLSSARCEHDDAFCMSASQRELPAASSDSSLRPADAARSRVVATIPTSDTSPPPKSAMTVPSTTLTLLATNLRV